MRRLLLAVAIVAAVAPSTAGAAIPVKGESAEDRKAARDLRTYLQRNASEAPWYEKLLEIRVNKLAITVRTSLKRSAAGRAAAKEICHMIQGSDVADFTPGHRVVDRKRVGIRRCPPRRF